MNDIGYIKEKFEDSICCTNVKTARKEELLNMLPYYEGAVLFHIKEQNPIQVIYFQSGVDMINKRLKRN